MLHQVNASSTVKMYCKINSALKIDESHFLPRARHELNPKFLNYFVIPQCWHGYPLKFKILVRYDSTAKPW